MKHTTAPSAQPEPSTDSAKKLPQSMKPCTKACTNLFESRQVIFVQGDLNSRTVFDDHESGGSQAKDVLLEARRSHGLTRGYGGCCDHEAGVLVVSSRPPRRY